MKIRRFKSNQYSSQKEWMAKRLILRDEKLGN